MITDKYRGKNNKRIKMWHVSFMPSIIVFSVLKWSIHDKADDNGKQPVG